MIRVKLRRLTGCSLPNDREVSLGWACRRVSSDGLSQEAFKAAKDVPLEKVQGVIKQTKDAVPDSVPNPLRESDTLML